MDIGSQAEFALQADELPGFAAPGAYAPRSTRLKPVCG
jgi:hypothetical protein